MINKRKIGFGLIFIGLVLGLSNVNITGAVIGTSGVAGWLAFLMFFSFVSGGLLVGMSGRIEEGDLERSLPERVPEGTFEARVPKLKYRNYKFIAYAGDEVISEGRREHLINGRPHITIKSPDLKKDLRVDVYILEEVDGQTIDRGLRRYLNRNSKYMRDQVETYFHTGKFDI